MATEHKTKVMLMLNGDWVEQRGDKAIAIPSKKAGVGGSKWGGSGSWKNNGTSAVYVPGTGTYSSTSTYESCKHKWVPVFTYEGIKIFGSAKSDISDHKPEGARLIVNCTGYSYNTPKGGVVKSAPQCMQALAAESYMAKLQTTDELLLDWDDGKAVQLIPQFWPDLLTKAKEAGYEEMVVCCLGGHGRTGTALVSLALAAGLYIDPDTAIKEIRAKHCKKAVESYDQIDYIEWVASKLCGWKATVLDKTTKQYHCTSHPSK